MFVPLDTGMNTLQIRYKLSFNLTMTPLYLVKVKIAQKQLTAYGSFQTFAESCSMWLVVISRPADVGLIILQVIATCSNGERW